MAIVLSSAMTGAALGSRHEKLASSSPAPPTGQWFDYAVTIMLENHSINFTYYNGGSVNSCLGNCTYFTSLANSNGLAEGLTDGGVNASAGSYLAITSAVNAPQACNNAPNASGCPFFTTPDIVDSLDKNGLTWKAYMEGYPQPASGCFIGYNSGAPFYYTPIHNPFLYYADIANNNTRCARIVAANSQPVTQSSTGCWPTALQNDDVLLKDLNSVTNASNYMFLTPNTVDQAHDCNDVSAGNAWMNEMIPQILNSNLFKTKRAALFVTFDEPGCTNPAGQPPCPSGASPDLYSVWASNPSNPTTKSGFKSTQTYTLFSALKAVEVNWNLASFNTNDGNANSMSEFFQLPLLASFTITPSSPLPNQQVTFTATVSGGILPYGYSWRFGDGGTATTNPATHTYTAAGSYNVQLTVTDKTGATRNATQTLILGPDFSLSSSLSSLTIHTGGSNTTTINLSSINSFSGTVSLTTSVSPAGLTTSLIPPSVSLTSGGNGASTLTLSSSTPGTYTVNVTGTTGSITHLTTITARVVTPDFSITSSPTSLTTPLSTTGTSTISLTSLIQFSGTVTLTTSITPSGLTASLSPPTITLSSGGSASSTLTVSPTNFGSYTVTVKGASGTLSHSTNVTVTVVITSPVIASDSATGPTSLYTTGEKLLQDSAGKMIAVYVDSTGRIGLSYANSDPVQAGWSTPAKSPTPTSSYAWPAAVLVSPTLLHIIVGGGTASGDITDIPVTITRDSQNNITGFTFGTATTLDASGLAKYPSAILTHNGDILLAWAWMNTTASLVKSLRWDPTTGWTNLAGTSTIPDNVLVDTSVLQWFVPNLIERPDNHNIYLFADKFTGSSRIAFDKATWNNPGWTWGTQNLTYETNASDADDDAISLSWDPGKSLVVAAYGITGTHTYGVFTLTASDVKTHMDTPTLAVTGDRGWGGISVQTITGDYILILISVSGDAQSGPLGYIQMPAGGSWNATITWLNSATDNQVTNLRIGGPSPAIDLLYVEGTSAPAKVRFLRLNPPNFSITATPTSLTIPAGTRGTSTLTVSSLYALAGTVNLSTTVSPTGPTVSLSPASLILMSGGTNSSTLTLNATTTGAYTVTILGTRGSISHSTIVTYTVTGLTLTASPASVTILAPATGTSTISVSNPASGNTNLAAIVSPTTGLTCSLSPTIVAGTTGSSILSCNGSAGAYTVTVTGTSGSTTAQTTVTFTVQDFTIAASPATVTVNAGTAATSTITIAEQQGPFTVNLASNSTSCTISPTSVSASGSATLSCTFTSASVIHVTVTGSAGSLSHSTIVTYTVQDYTIAANPTIVTVNVGTAGPSTITITGLKGFAGTVSLASNSTTSCTLSPTSVTGTGNSTLSCTFASAGIVHLTITGTSSSLSHSVTVTYTVQDFTIVASPANVNENNNSAAISSITVTGLDGFAAIVNLATNTTSSCTVSPTSVTGSGSATLSCTFNSTGNKHVLVTGTSSLLSHSSIVTFVVQDFSISASPSTVNVNVNAAGASTITIAAVNGFAGLVNLATNSTYCTLSPSSVTGSGTSGLSCTFTSVGTFHIAVNGTSVTILHALTVTYLVQDFALATSPTIFPVNAGSAGTSTVIVTGVNGFAGVVTLSSNSTLCTITPTSVTGSGIATLSCTFSSAGNVDVKVTGSNGNLSRSANVLYTVQDYAMIASPSTVSVIVGTVANSTITVTYLNGFAGQVVLATNSTSCTISPTTTTASVSAILSCTFRSAQQVHVTITGTSGSLSHTATVTYTIQDFTIAASPTSIIATAGTIQTSSITITSLGGLTGTVNLAFSVIPSNGLTCTLTPTTVTLGSSATSTLSCSGSGGTYNVTIAGAISGVAHTGNVAYTVQDFTLSANPTIVNILPGGTGQSIVTVASTNGFTGRVDLGSTVSPAVGLTCTLSAKSVSLNGPNVNGTVTLSCTSSTTSVFTVTVTGTNGGLPRTATVTFNSGDFSITAIPSTVTSLAGSMGTSSLTVSALNGFSAVVTLATNSTSCTVSPTSVAGSGTSTLSCTFSSAGTFAVGVTGTSGSLSHSVTVTYAVQDFTITANLTSVTVNLATAGASKITVTGLNGFLSVVNLATNSTSSCTMTPTSATGSGNATLSCTFTSSGNKHVSVTGTSGSLSHSIPVTFVVQDFTVTGSPTSMSVNAGTTGTSTITVTLLNGLAGVVSLTTNSTSCTLNPASVTGSGNSTHSCLFTSTGVFQVTVTGSSGSLSHSVTVTYTVQDFTISATPPGPVNAGNSASSTIMVTGLDQFTGTVSLTDTIPTGLTCSPLTPATVIGSGTAQVSCTANNAGNYTLAVTGTSTNLVHTTSSTFAFRDYAMVASSPAQTNAGTSVSATITVTSLNGFSATVSLTDTVPSGLGCGAITPPSVTGSGNATVSCTSSTAGNYNLVLTGTSGSLTHTATATFSFQDFTTSATTPAPVDATQSATSTITIAALNHFSGTVSLLDTVPSGLTCGTISPASVSGSGPATVSCNANIAANYTLIVTGSSGALSHSATIILRFQDFNMTAMSPAAINAGQSPTSSITVGSINGFAGIVTFSLTSSPGLTCGSFMPITVTGSGSATVSCSASIAGNYTATISGTSTVLVHNATATFQFRDFTIAGTSPAPVNAGSSASSTITLTAVNHFAGSVSLSDTIPSGLTCGTITPSSMTGSGTATVSCSATTAGNYTLTMIGISGTLVHNAIGMFRFQNFTISATSPAPVSAGQSATSTITITSANGFAGVVTLTDTIPSGLACSAIAPGSVTGSGTATVSCSATSAGTYVLTLAGTTGTLVHTATATFNFVDFTIAASSPTPANSGSSANSTITVASVNGFAGTVSLNDTAPNGLTCGTSTPNSVTGSGTATVSCSATIAGNYTLTLTGTAGSLIHTVTAFFQFQDFTVVGLSPVGANVGASTASTITVTALNHFSGTVSFSETVPSGLTCGTISPATVTGSGTATVSCHAALAGNYTLTLTGTSGPLVHVATTLFQFWDFNATASSPSPVNAGTSAISTITITAANHFNGIVSLTDNVPSGIACGVITPTSVTGSGTAIVSCSATVAGNYTLSITGTNGTLSHSVTVVLSFQDYAISASLGSVQINARSSGSSTITINALNHFSGTVSLSVFGTTGITSSINPSSLPGGSGTATLTFSASTAGNYTVTIGSSSGTLTHATTVNVQIVDFAIVANPSITILAGATGNSTLTVSATNGFSGIVKLLLTPSMGLTATAVPASIQGSGPSTMYVTGSTSGDYSVTIKATSGSLSHTIVVAIHVVDYSLAGNPVTLVSPVGSSTSSSLTLQSLNHYAGNLSLTYSVHPDSSVTSAGGGGGGRPGLRMAPPGPILPVIFISLQAFSLASDGTQLSTVGISLPSDLPAGNYLITVMASDGTLSHQIVIILSATDFSITATPNSASLQPGSNTTIVLNLKSLNNFQGNVSLTVTSQAGGPNGTLSTSIIQLTFFSIMNLNLTIQAPANTALGNYTITVQATSGAVSHSLNIPVRVTASGFVTILAEILSPQNSAPISMMAIFTLLTTFATLKIRAHRKRETSLYWGRKIENLNYQRSRTTQYLPYSSSLPLLWGPTSRDEF